jgi:hypothetical protein
MGGIQLLLDLEFFHLVLHDYVDNKSEKVYHNLLNFVNLESVMAKDVSFSDEKTSTTSLGTYTMVQKLTTEDIQCILTLLEKSKDNTSGIYDCFTNSQETGFSLQMKSERLSFLKSLGSSIGSHSR